LQIIPKVRFIKEWTGYLLISEPSKLWRSWAVAAFAGALGGGVAFSLVRRRRSVGPRLTTLA
jgi:hypothetical protein